MIVHVHKIFFCHLLLLAKIVLATISPTIYIIEDAVTITLLCILAIKIKKFCEIDQQVSTIQRQPRQKFCSTNITINSIVV